MIIYPGGPVGSKSPIPSMRLKWIREDIRDFEYIAILKRLGRGDWALHLVRTVGSDWHDRTHDVAVLESVRRQMGDEIERLSAQSVASAGSREK